MAQMNEKSARDFVQWLKVSDPFLYDVAVKAQKIKDKKDQEGLGGIFDLVKTINFKEFAKTAIDTVKDVAPKVIEFKQQKDLLDVQIKRAQAGLPALDTSQYSVTVPNYDPAYVTAQQQTMMDRLAYQSVYQPSYNSGGVTSYLPWIAAGGLALVLVLKN